MIKLVLLDADGVIQSGGVDFVAKLQALVPENGAAFTQDLFTAEQPAATGEAKFRDILETVLARWSVSTDINDVLAIWQEIQVIGGLFELVGDLQQAGLQVGLATNQQDERMRYMSQTLGYGSHFDYGFYSFAVGAKKPDRAFFEHIISHTGFEPETCLFVDDSQANVDGALAIGMKAECFAFSSVESAAGELRTRLAKHVQFSSE